MPNSTSWAVSGVPSDQRQVPRGAGTCTGGRPGRSPTTRRGKARSSVRATAPPGGRTAACRPGCWARRSPTWGRGRWAGSWWATRKRGGRRADARGGRPRKKHEGPLVGLVRLREPQRGVKGEGQLEQDHGDRFRASPPLLEEGEQLPVVPRWPRPARTPDGPGRRPWSGTRWRLSSSAAASQWWARTPRASSWSPSPAAAPSTRPPSDAGARRSWAGVRPVGGLLDQGVLEAILGLRPAASLVQEVQPLQVAKPPDLLHPRRPRPPGAAEPNRAPEHRCRGQHVADVAGSRRSNRARMTFSMVSGTSTSTSWSNRHPSPSRTSAPVSTSDRTSSSR